MMDVYIEWADGAKGVVIVTEADLAVLRRDRRVLWLCEVDDDGRYVTAMDAAERAGALTVEG